MQLCLRADELSGPNTVTIPARTQGRVKFEQQFEKLGCLINLPLKDRVLHFPGTMTQKSSEQIGFLISSELI